MFQLTSVLVRKGIKGVLGHNLLDLGPTVENLYTLHNISLLFQSRTFFPIPDPTRTSLEWTRVAQSKRTTPPDTIKSLFVKSAWKKQDVTVMMTSKTTLGRPCRLQRRWRYDWIINQEKWRENAQKKPALLYFAI